jgi:PPOX class probable F420-dependent enzyme
MWCRNGGFIARPYDEIVTIDDLAAGKYISLATFKRDGSRVATPVWVTRDGDHLYVITDPNSGKAKRLRNSARAEIASCDARGRTSADYVPASAVLLDDAGTQKVRDLVNAKYGLMGKGIQAMGKLRSALGRGSNQQVGIEITLG